MTEIDPTNVSTAYLAECFGMTRDGVTRLCRAGVISQNGVARGKYNLFDAVPAYLQHLRASKGGESAATRLAIQRERKLRLQNDETEAGLVPIRDAALVFATASAMFRADVNSRIEGMAAKISKTDNPRNVAKSIQSELFAVGQAAYDGLPKVEENER